MAGDPVRAASARTIDRVMRSGAYSNIVVHETPLQGRDRAAHQNLVFSALRWLVVVDRAIDEAANRSLTSLDPLVLAVLRIAGTELVVLGHAPHAVVDGAVDTIRALGQQRSSGFVNAVARSMADRAVPVVDPLDSYPGWIKDACVGYVPDGAALLSALNAPAPVGLRRRTGGVIDAAPVPGIDGAFYATPTTPVSQLEEAGTVDVVDPATTAVVQALAPSTGARCLDVAAAPGGKTRAIADRIGRMGRLVAADVHGGRVRKARRRSTRYTTVRWVRADGTLPPWRVGSFDAVLLDAPCTGLGTLRRRPEIRHRLEPGAPERFGRLQRSMLERSLELVRPGGRLVYSVCTPFPEETIDVVAGMGGTAPERPNGTRWGDGLLLGPDTTGTDGMFISVFDR